MKAGFLKQHRRTSARHSAHGWLTIFFLMAWARFAHAETVEVQTHEHDGTYHIEGRFAAEAPDSVAWSVLTDYTHIREFVGSLRSSTIQQRTDGRLVVLQDATAGFFPFRRTIHVALELQEEGPVRLTFHDILGRDFEQYDGEWRITADSTGTLVQYVLDARPRASLPSVLIRSMMGRSVGALLTQVCNEMDRRALKLAQTAPSVPPVGQ